MVWVVQRDIPNKIHDTLESAKTEAERLARKEGPAVTVRVIEIVAECRVEVAVPPIIWK